jgi:hypothetical protein
MKGLEESCEKTLKGGAASMELTHKKYYKKPM